MITYLCAAPGAAQDTLQELPSMNDRPTAGVKVLHHRTTTTIRKPALP